MTGEGRESRIGESESEQKGSEISDVGETRGILPVDEDRRVVSSNIFRTTTLGSSLGIASDLMPLIGLVATELTDSGTPFDRDRSPSSEYSGKPEKLSGVTTTW